MLRLPLLRAGRPHRSLRTQTLTDVRSGAPVVEVSQAAAGMIARDLAGMGEHRRLLEGFTVAELLAACRDAAHHFAHSRLPLGDDSQDLEDYLAQLAATTGMPVAMGRANAGKIVSNLENMTSVLDGLTRGLDLRVLDHGCGEQHGRTLSYLRQSDALGAVLPNNSPGVHALWLPAIALKTPLALKPGSTEPWTPWRIAQALIAAGCPPQAFSIYPSDHSGATEVLLRTGRSLFFGDARTVRAWHGSGKVQVHGPGGSKVLLLGRAAEGWRDHLALMVGSVAANGGRSCINASSVWTTADGDAIAEALAERLAAIEPRPLDDPQAALAAFAQPRMAHAISELIDQQLTIPGAADITARWYPEGRVAQINGCTFLRPTVIRCTDPRHPLAATELGFPFVAVVEIADPQALLASIGPTLVASALGAADLESSLLACPHIDRLNLGAIPTYQISWDQPHEGNLFDHLFQQRAFKRAPAGA